MVSSATILNSSNDQKLGIEKRQLVEQTSNTKRLQKSDLVATEAPIALTYNGQSHAVMMASPIDLEDFAIGFSLTERIIDRVDQVIAVEINAAKRGFAINIQVDPTCVQRLDQQRRQMSGRSGCGICGISDLAAAIPQLSPLQAQQAPAHSIIAAAVEDFQANQSLQRECGATHAAALFDQHGNLVALREDIGRHNAFDKLIGCLLKQQGRGIKEHDFALLSSRASHELITKSVIANIGTLVAISAATTLAVDMAAELNLNLIGFLRGNRQLVYHQNS